MVKFGLNWLIGYRATKFGENIWSILYDINLFEKYDQYEKKFISKTVFDITSVYPIFSKSVY